MNDFQEYFDMFMVLGECRKYYRNVQDLYAACYPDRQQKSHMAFKRLADRFCLFGTVKQTQQHKFHPYRMSLHPDLHNNDFLKRFNFCNLIRKKCAQMSHF